MSITPLLAAHKTHFHGWAACEVANSYIRLVAVPDIGGRIMAYDLGAHPFFFVDPDLAGKLFTPEENQGDGSLAAWKNYGGEKTWPAPQGWETDAQWHGPPDPILDTGRYTLDDLQADDRHATVAMTSPSDPRTGVQITRRFTLFPGSSRVRVDLQFRNIAARPIRWSIWDVVQLRAEHSLPDGSRGHDPSCVVTTPVNRDSRFDRGFQVMFGAADNPQWQVEHHLFKADYRWEIGKVGIDSTAGWIAFNQGSQRVAFVEQFVYIPHGEYPDGGATVECWTVGAGQVGNLDYAESGIYLMETEVLSPLFTIQPHETAHFAVDWASCRCAGAVVDVQPAGCATQPLTAVRQGAFVQITGAFGVFDAGELLLVLRNIDEEALLYLSLGSVDPLGAILLDRWVSAPANAIGVELAVRAMDDRVTHRLAAVTIK